MKKHLILGMTLLIFVAMSMPLVGEAQSTASTDNSVSLSDQDDYDQDVTGEEKKEKKKKGKKKGKKGKKGKKNKKPAMEE
ncbi:MAG: hypothetical protein QNJ97_22795 [Myxococcota bacterium]|nr:hypothetical protein [Myxococcota bacterium]